MDELYENFERLKKLFIENNQEPWTSCEFDFNNEGKLNVSFDYIDWKNSEFGPLARKPTSNIQHHMDMCIAWITKVEEAYVDDLPSLKILDI